MRTVMIIDAREVHGYTGIPREGLRAMVLPVRRMI